jgi:glycosyltransferase involved in cell wall biosynthesis
MGAYEACLSPALHVRAAMLGVRVAKAGARRVARVLGAQRAAQMRAAAAGAMAQSAEETVARAAWIIEGAATVRGVDARAAGARARAQRADGRDAGQRCAVGEESERPRVAQVIGSLAAGGAERQLALFAECSQGLGLARQSVVTLNPCEGAHAHYASIVERAGVAVRHAGAAADPAARAWIARDTDVRARLRAMPMSLRPYATDLAGEFIAMRPDAVHAWLDHANICAGVAALAVGVPRVVLTFRSLNPTHFPAWCQPWMLPWYRVLAADARVRMCANSEAGADDYARWIGIDRARIGVVRNGLDPSVLASADDAQRSALRVELGAVGRPLVIGVFRIGDEKQPMLFAEVARRVLAKEPRAIFCVAGDGPMRDELARAVAPMGESFRLLGRRNDAIALLATADVALLTSRVEGTPNVLVEAQAMGTPVVATKVGGIPDAVRDGSTGILAESGDADGLARGVLAIVHDDALRARMSADARAFTHAEFSLERMSRSMCALYA